jgi:uncharacterized membrane protein YkvA (DUF1232 family)
MVAKDFWRKFAQVAGRLPFAEDLAAAWYCATDPETPTRAKAILIAALAYFVIPFDAIPDFLAGIGFTDDAAAIALAIRTVSKHMKPEHYACARQVLARPDTTIREEIV